MRMDGFMDHETMSMLSPAICGRLSTKLKPQRWHAELCSMCPKARVWFIVYCGVTNLIGSIDVARIFHALTIGMKIGLVFSISLRLKCYKTPHR